MKNRTPSAMPAFAPGDKADADFEMDGEDVDEDAAAASAVGLEEAVLPA